MQLWHRLRAWRKESPAIGNPAEVNGETWHRLNNWQKFLLIALCVLAYIVCVAPTFTSNVLPHILASVNADGTLNGGEITSSVYLTGTVILLTVAPLVMLHVSLVRTVALLVMCVVIGYVNINNATGTMGSARDAKTDAPRQKLDRITRLDAEIENNTKAWQQVPAHKHVTDALVKTAEAAFETLKKSARDECNSGPLGLTRGPRCGELERKRDAKSEELVQLQADKDLTDRATGIEVEITKLKKQREQLGAAPDHIDAETERFVGFLALLHLVSQDQAKAFSENKPVIDAICMELMAFVGAPSLIIGIFVLFGKMASSQSEADKRMLEVLQRIEDRKAAKAAEQHTVVLDGVTHLQVVESNRTFAEMFSPSEIEHDGREVMLPDTPPAEALGIVGDPVPAFVEAPETVAEVKAAALLKADPHKKPGRKARGKPKEASRESVLQWVRERTMQRPGRRTAYGDAIADYNNWCEEVNLIPLPAPTVGKTLVTEVNVQKVKKGGTLYYMDFGLHPAALRVAAG